MILYIQAHDYMYIIWISNVVEAARKYRFVNSRYSRFSYTTACYIYMDA